MAVDYGFEVQIDQLAAPDGAPIHMTGAIYDSAAPSSPAMLPVRPLGAWNEYEIRVDPQNCSVRLNGRSITSFNFTPGSDPLHTERGLSSTDSVPRYIGLQTHSGRVGFRNIQIMDLAAVSPTPAAEAPPISRGRAKRPGAVAAN